MKQPPRRTVTLAPAPSLSPSAVPNQLELFISEFQSITGLSNTNTIELMDALPLYQQQAYSVPTDTPRIEDIEFRKQKIKVTVKPAQLLENGKMRNAFAGTREQLVEATLRKMMSEPGDHVHFVKDSGGNVVPTLHTSPYAIRKRLSEIGHGYKLVEIRQALDILGNTKFFMTIFDGKEEVDLEGEHAIIGRSHRTPHSDATGERSRERITLHPLVLRSIVERTYRQIDWRRFTGLKRPGARWLYARLIHHFTGVQRGGGAFSAPYNIDLETILASSGMRRYIAGGVPIIKDNVRQVRLDLKEMTAEGILDPMRPYVERLRKGRDQGKRGPQKMLGAVWDLYASREAAEEIVKTNVKMKTVRLA
jgi:hypothetical protein